MARVGHFDRRGFLMGATASGLALTTSAAFARSGGVDQGQAEWRQQYDSSPLRDKPVASEAPILSPQTIAATEAAIGQFQQIVQRGGWQRAAVHMPRLPQLNGQKDNGKQHHRVQMALAQTHGGGRPTPKAAAGTHVAWKRSSSRSSPPMSIATLAWARTLGLAR